MLIPKSLKSMLLITLTLVLTTRVSLAGDSANTATLSAAERHLIRSGCEYLVYRYLHLLEARQGETADLFTANGDAFGYVGREVIRKRFTEIQKADTHVNVLISSNLQIEVFDKNHATGSGYVTHYTSAQLDPAKKDPSGGLVSGELEAPKSITRWTWEFRLIDDEWRISKISYPESVLLRKDVLDTL